MVMVIINETSGATDKDFTVLRTRNSDFKQLEWDFVLQTWNVSNYEYTGYVQNTRKPL